MAKTLLRSGCRDDFQAVGGGGQAVFDSALQIRETLRLRKQLALVDCLAIPQVNDDGDRIDWYSPVDGEVTAWKAADDESRHRALQQLENLHHGALQLAQSCLLSSKTSQRRFGALLEKAMQFPGDIHVFLVGGKPVMTFWGFVNLNESARDELFACLDIAPPTVEPELPEPAIPPAIFSEADSPLFTPPPVVAAEPEPEEEEAPAIVTLSPPPAAKPVRRLPLWSLPVAAVVVAAVAAPLLWPRDTTSAEPALVSTQSVAVVKPVMPEVTASLPLHLASVTAPVKEEKPEPKPVVIAPIPKDALVMESDQLRAGTTRFLNGNWRVLVEVKDPISGKAPSLRYQILNNKGTARLVHGDNVVCRAEIFSGLHQNGELMIKSRGAARCSDGSRYPMPEISCQAGTSDIAECTGRYDANTVVPITFRKTGA